jgi:nucleoside-diphosphate-sugar epimerase
MRGLVTVFGGTGFVGRQVVRSLAKQGWRIRVAARNVGRGYRLRMLGDVGQIEVVQANIRDAASVGRALDGAEACVNLVGVLYESGRQGFATLHAEAAGAIAQAAAARGITRFVQMSAIGADALREALETLVPWNLRRLLDEEAPTHFEAPTGSSVALDYEAEGGPVLAIRVQELYGLKVHPALVEAACR